MNFTNETISDHEKNRLKAFLDDGLKVLLEIDDLKGGLRDLTKTIAEELNVEAKVLTKALRCEFKQTLANDKEVMDVVEEILVVTGRA